MKYFWLIYLQFLFVVGQFNRRKNWIDKHILICYNELDKLGYLEKDENIFKDIIARCRRIQRMEELPDIESVKHDRWCSCVNYNG